MLARGLDVLPDGANCEDCDLIEQPFVGSVGNKDADIAVIGKAPSADEVKKGKPFTDRAGEILNGILKEVGIERSELYMTNTVCCKPEDNRDPRAKEYKSCHGRMINELEEVDPDIILIMGNIPLRSMLGETGITKWRGGVEEYPGKDWIVIPTFHPASILRNPSWRDDVVEDLRLTKKISERGLSVLEEHEPDYQWLTTTEAMVKLSRMDEVVVDVETSSEGSLLCIGFADVRYPDKQYIISYEHINSNLQFKNYMIAHNMKFEAQVFWRHGIECNFTMCDDTMLMHYAMDPRKGQHGLKKLANNYFHAGNYDQDIQQYITEMEKCPEDLMFRYNALDVYFTAKLYNKFVEEMSEREQYVYNRLLIPTMQTLTEMEYKGIPIDVEELERTEKYLDGKLHSITERIYEFAGKEFNLNSWQQKAEVLYEDLEIPIPGRLSTDKDALEKIKDYHPIIPLMQEYNKLNKLQGTYTKGMKEKLDEENKLHTNFNVHGTETGRLSSSGPNLQNIPKRGEHAGLVKNLFVPEEGKVLWEADFSQAELRCLAYYSNDPTLMETFHKRDDIHTTTAAGIYEVSPEDVTEEQRDVGKTANFAILYGVSPHGLSKLLDSSKEEAKEVIKGWFNLYPKAEEFMREVQEKALEDGYVDTPTGRRRYFYPAGNNTGFIRRQAGNTPIQSLAWDVTRESMVDIHLQGYDIRLTVHDSVIGMSDKDEFDPYPIKKTMEESANELLNHKVPFVVDISVGLSWGDMEELDL